MAAELGNEATGDYLPEAGGNGDEHGQDIDIEASLEVLAEGWDEVEEKTYGDVPDGKYQCEIESVVIEHAKSSGRLQVTWTLLIIGGGYPPGSQNGRKMWKRDGLETEENRGWFRGGLARIGVSWPENPKMLPDKLQELIGSKAQVSATTKEGGDRQNYYFDKALDDGDIDQPIEEDLGQVQVQPPVPAPQPRARQIAPTQPARAAAPAARAAAPAPARAPGRAAPRAPVSAPVEPTMVESDDDHKVSVTFEDVNLTKKIQALILTEAARLEFDPADYDTKTDLMCDMAEIVGLDGEYDDPGVLMQEIAAVATQEA